MNKEYRTTSDMLKGIGLDDEFTGKVQEEINKRNLTHLLTALRCKGSLNQKQLAAKTKWSQSRVSRVENSCDFDIKIGDLVEYARGLGYDVEISIRQPMNLVENVKYFACRVRGCLDELGKLAQGDQTILNSLRHFYNEAAFNFLKIAVDAKKQWAPTAGKLTICAPSVISSVGEDCKQETTCTVSG